jgi:predicted patatin/cPLA2 family phospholipase
MISAQVSQLINVNLSDSEAKDIVVKYVCASFNWQASYFIRIDEKSGEDWVFNRSTFYSSHSFDAETRMRKASERDKLAYEFLKEIINT